MTQDITQEAVRGLSAAQMDNVERWICLERKARADRHKQETLAKIRELAKSIDIGVKIEGVRGRQAKSKP